MRTEIVKIEEAVGKIICHDITKIIKGQFKGAAFKKGHRIQNEDIDDFLKLGKEHVFVLELDPDEIHEDEAGSRLAKAAAGSGVSFGQPKESRVNLFADKAGLLKINIAALEAMNDLPDVILSTLLNNTVVNKGDMLAGTKVIPLVVKEKVIVIAEKIAREAGEIVKVVPFKEKKISIIVTGNELYKGRIKDTFGPVLCEKVEAYGSKVLELIYAPDNADVIAQNIIHSVEQGAEIIMVSGGMSVDPDDVTPLGIQLSGAEIIKYGAPALPGAMFLMAYRGDVAVLGIPACGMYFRTTVLDLLLPRLLAGERITRKEIVKLAHGGLCRSCDQCRYPNCGFGMGISLE